MNSWRWIFGAALLFGVAYLTWRVALQIQLTRFMLDRPDFRDEPYLAAIGWIWSSIPVAVLWCSVAFVGFTSGMGLRVTRLVVLGIGIMAISILVAFVLAVVFLPVRKL